MGQPAVIAVMLVCSFLPLARALAQTTNAPAVRTQFVPIQALTPATPTTPAAPAAPAAASPSPSSQPTPPPPPPPPSGSAGTTNEVKTAARKESGAASGLASAISNMKFERTPEAVFEAVQSQKSGGKLSEAERFRLAVLLGDWEQVGRALKTLPADQGMRAYSRLLEAMASNSLSADQLFKQVTSRSSSSSSSSSASGQPKAPDKRSLLLSEDLYALLAAAPADLTASHLSGLTTLIKVAVGPAGRQDFLKRLAKGLRGYGGSAPSGRKLAAQLLSSVGWMSDAGAYLPLERREWNDADTLTLVLTLEYFTQTGVEKKDERQLKRAAEVCAFMMQTSRFGSDEGGIFRQATDRFVKLLPALEADDAEQLVRENFLTQPAIMVDLILALGEAGQQAARGNDVRLRQQSLSTQNIVLRVLQGKKSALPEAVNLLVMNWLVEAEQTYRLGGAQSPDNGFESDGYVVYRSYSSSRGGTPKTIDAPFILEQAPSATIIRRLNPGLAQRVKLTLLKVNLLNPKEPMTVETLRGYVQEHPGQEKDLCEDYLNAWVRKRTVVAEDPNITRLRLLGYSVPKPQAAGIPLTRLRQNQNIQDLKALLAELRRLSPEPIDPKIVVQSFMSIHSGAEVYRIDDIEAIFGAADKMSRDEMMNLVSGMRTKLHEQWRDQKNQQDAGTNRTEEETKDEVSRGYRTALELVKRGLRPENSDWKEFIVRGQLFFDTSEYEFSRQVKLTDYVNLRDEAFASYRKAAELYAAKVPQMARGQWTTEPYQMWFFVMLGASDLSQLTRAAARSDPGLKQIGDAMRALPGEAAEVHLQRFAEMLGSVLSQVPANMKQRFLSAGLQIVGEKHSAAQVARDALNSYQELLDEVQLRLELDGPARVGFSQPFGAFISLEHTKQLARESGGFSKYLQNISAQNRAYYIPSPGQKPVNYRDEFAKNIHAALDETFEVISTTFHDANVKAIPLTREGWEQTPLAYVVLRAKDAAVDRIPSIQLDMDFSDQAGQVVLPVRTQVQPIEARDAAVPARPCDELSLLFTMDEREWRDGKVVIEVSARGRGVIPPHPLLFESQQPGFDLEVTDNGLSITQFESDGQRKIPQADRNWQFSYRRKKDLRGDVQFHFPALKGELKPKTVEYKHYEDADLVVVDPKKAAAGVLLVHRASRGLQIGAAAAGVMALAALGFVWSRRRKTPVGANASVLEIPAQLTPFSVIAFLRRIQKERAARLDDAARTALQAQIRELETSFFSVGSRPGAGSNLESVARKWHEVAG